MTAPEPPLPALLADYAKVIETHRDAVTRCDECGRAGPKEAFTPSEGFSDGSYRLLCKTCSERGGLRSCLIPGSIGLGLCGAGGLLVAAGYFLGWWLIGIPTVFTLVVLAVVLVMIVQFAAQQTAVWLLGGATFRRWVGPRWLLRIETYVTPQMAPTLGTTAGGTRLPGLVRTRMGLISLACPLTGVAILAAVAYRFAVDPPFDNRWVTWMDGAFALIAFAALFALLATTVAPRSVRIMIGGTLGLRTVARFSDEDLIGLAQLTWAWIAFARINRDQVPAAEAALKEGTERCGTGPMLRSVAASVAFWQSRFEEARAGWAARLPDQVTSLSQFTSLLGNIAAVDLLLGTAEARAEAMALADLAVSLYGVNPHYRAVRGFVLIESGQAEAGTALVRDALDQILEPPSRRLASCYLALAAVRRGETESARQLLDLVRSGGGSPALERVQRELDAPRSEPPPVVADAAVAPLVPPVEVTVLAPATPASVLPAFLTGYAEVIAGHRKATAICDGCQWPSPAADMAPVRRFVDHAKRRLCPVCRNRDWTWRVLTYEVLWAGIAALLGALIGAAVIDSDYWLAAGLASLVWAFASALVAISLHEFGHAIVAWLLGGTVTNIRIGTGRRLLRRRLGGTVLVWRAIPTEGWVRFGFLSDRLYRTRTALATLAGPLVNAVLIGAAFAWFRNSPPFRGRPFGWLDWAIVVFATANVFVLIASLTPVMRLPLFLSDGACLLIAAFMNDASVRSRVRYDARQAAEARREAGDLTGAEAVLQREVDSVPDDPDLRSARAMVWFWQGRFSEARAEWASLLPNAVKDHVRLATLIRDVATADLLLGTYESRAEAVALTQLAFDLNGVDPQVRAAHGYALVATGQADAGAAWVRHTLRDIEEPPERRFATCFLALAALRRDDRDTARRLLAEVRARGGSPAVDRVQRELDAG